MSPLYWDSILISVGVSMMKSPRNVKRLPLKHTSLYTLLGEWRRVELKPFSLYTTILVQWREESTKICFRGMEWRSEVVEWRSVHFPTNGMHPVYKHRRGSRSQELQKPIWRPVYRNSQFPIGYNAKVPAFFYRSKRGTVMFSTQLYPTYT